MTEATSGSRSDRAFQMIVLAIAVSVAVSFAVLFWDQYQRSADNKRAIAQNAAVIAQVQANAVRIKQNALAACLADRQQSFALRGVLAVFRDHAPPSFTAAQLTAYTAFFNVLIANVHVRTCPYPR